MESEVFFMLELIKKVHMFAAYVGSSGDLLCKSCLVWMCAAGWILSSSQTGAACCVPIWVGDLGMRRRRKKKSWEKKTSFCLLSA